jgi:hypothetical protein
LVLLATLGMLELTRWDIVGSARGSGEVPVLVGRRILLVTYNK